MFLDNVGSVPFATTGADGSYSLTVPASPDYQLRLGNTFSNASTAIPAFTLRADLPVEADTVLDLTIPVGPFTYVVQDNTNSPILGVTVRPEGNFETSVEVAPGLTMTGSVDLVTSGLDTDSNGEAVFGVLPADRQTFVEVTPPVESGLLPVFVDDVDPQPNAQTIITLEPAAVVTLSGVVRDGGGVPLEGLRVFLDNVGSVPFATTGADGSYSLTVPASPDLSASTGQYLQQCVHCYPGFHASG